MKNTSDTNCPKIISKSMKKWSEDVPKNLTFRCLLKKILWNRGVFFLWQATKYLSLKQDRANFVLKINIQNTEYMTVIRDFVLRFAPFTKKWYNGIPFFVESGGAKCVSEFYPTKWVKQGRYHFYTAFDPKYAYYRYKGVSVWIGYLLRYIGTLCGISHRFENLSAPSRALRSPLRPFRGTVKFENRPLLSHKVSIY